jgi:hypothetical protein
MKMTWKYLGALVPLSLALTGSLWYALAGSQWQVIVHHIRVRADITGADARAIADFLKSASQ